MDKIFIKGLRLEAIIGIHPHERTTKQPLIVDIDIFTNIHPASQTDKIDDTIDYDRIVTTVKNLANTSHFFLLESLIQRIADAILQEFGVSRVDCVIYKPRAIGDAQTVGIAISRELPSAVSLCT